jgi:hypothetical protein
MFYARQIKYNNNFNLQLVHLLSLIILKKDRET